MVSKPTSYPEDGTTKDFPEIGIVPGVFVVAGLDDNDSSRFIGTDPGQDRKAAGGLCGKKRLDVWMNQDQSVDLVVDGIVFHSPGDRMAGVDDMHLDVDPVFPGGSRVDLSIPFCGTEEVPASHDSFIFRPILVVGHGVMEDHQAFAGVEAVDEVGFGFVRDLLPEIVKYQDVPGISLFRRPPLIDVVGVFDVADLDSAEGVKHLEEQVGMVGVAAGD